MQAPPVTRPQSILLQYLILIHLNFNKIEEAKVYKMQMHADLTLLVPIGVLPVPDVSVKPDRVSHGIGN